MPAFCAAILQDSGQDAEHWKDAEGQILRPSRWTESLSARDAANQGAGRCIGLNCLPWIRCADARELTHQLFGGSKRGDDQGWGALMIPVMTAGTPKFLGGMAVLKHLWIKIAEFLHYEHGRWFPSLNLPHFSERLRLEQVLFFSVM